MRALDGYGNTSSATTRTWTVDAVAPPAPSIDSGPAAASTSGKNVTFGFSDTEGTATFEVQIDGGGYTTSTSPKAYTNLADGSHTFAVRALDTYGNTSSSTSRTWTVDAVAPPAPTIDSGELAERLAWHFDAEEQIVPGWRRDGELDSAMDAGIDRGARVTFTEEHLAGAQIDAFATGEDKLAE